MLACLLSNNCGSLVKVKLIVQFQLGVITAVDHVNQ